MGDARLLDDRRYVSFVVRLLIDAAGNLVSAEVIRVPDTAGPRVRSWQEIPDVIRAAIERDPDDTRAGRAT